MGLAWIGLVLSFAASLVGLQMVLTTDFKSNSNGISLNLAGMHLEATKEYWLTTYYLLHPQNSSSPPIIPGSAQWNAMRWLTTSDPHAPLHPNERLMQRYALACLYFHWDGPSWLFSTPSAGWLDLVTQAAEAPDGSVTILATPPEGSSVQSRITTKAQVPFHECEWLGVTCNSQNHVVALDFKSASFVLTGNVPSELGLLSHLTSLDFSGKRLSGALPKQLPAALSALKHLDLKSNRFNVMDQDWEAWSNLESVNLAGNRFQGELPKQSLAAWSNIRSFDIHDNPVTGNFWQEILSHWPHLERLDISLTELTGSIPEVTKDGPLSRLEALYASRIPLTGTIPASLSVATNLKVLKLTDIWGMGLTPTELPTEFGRLTKLEALGLSSATALKGTLPTEIGLMTSLRHIDLYGNTHLKGMIPTEIGNLKELEYLKLCYTGLSGTVPEELGTLSNLAEVQLHQTNLVGTIPQAMCSGFIGVLTADCGVLRENAVPQIECELGCCECYT